MEFVHLISKTLSKAYEKSSLWAKILLFIVLLLIVQQTINGKGIKGREGMEGNNNDDGGDKGLELKDGPDIYDEFYVNIYDLLVFSGSKDEYEVNQMVADTNMNEDSAILDVGCGTGHHVGLLCKMGIPTIGVDNSVAMVTKCLSTYPTCHFEVGDVRMDHTFSKSVFTHILCLYFTLYYMQDKRKFFQNCFGWLKPSGIFVCHIVDRNTFDPILPPSNPLVMLTPQRYAKERITNSSVTFEEFKYTANFDLQSQNNRAIFTEKFMNKQTGNVFRKQRHEMYMESEDDIVEIAKKVGFIVQSKIDLIKAGYEYQYLYTFVKPQ